MSYTYLTTKELSERIKYSQWTIRNELKDSVLLEGRHYIRPFGQKKILFIWENIEADMVKESLNSPFAMPIECWTKQHQTGSSTVDDLSNQQ